jgi:predicted metalloprotease
MKRIIALAVLVLTLAVALGGTTERAEALNPNQTSVTGVVNALYWDVDRFWGLSGYDPGVGYYNYAYNGGTYQYQTSCRHTSTAVGMQGFYCNGGHIYLDWNQQTGHLRSIGDGAVAVWLAHEYAHHAEWALRISWNAPYHELLADCFAGLYFRWGVYQSGKLNYNDYLEARTMLSRMAPSSPTHGGAASRVRAFDYGFARVGYTSCTSGWQYW